LNKKVHVQEQTNLPVLQVWRKSTYFFKKLSWSFFFQSKFHFLDFLSSNSSCCEWRPCVTKFGADCTCGHISLDTVRFQSHNDVWISWKCWLIWVCMQSVGEERNAYRCLFLCLVQYRTQRKMSFILL